MVQRKSALVKNSYRRTNSQFEEISILNLNHLFIMPLKLSVPTSLPFESKCSVGIPQLHPTNTYFSRNIICLEKSEIWKWRKQIKSFTTFSGD